MLAGIPVEDQLVLDLASRLRDTGLDDAAEALENAYDAERRVATLTIADREAILRVLEDCSDKLAELRGVCSGSTRGAWSTALAGEIPRSARRSARMCGAPGRGAPSRPKARIRRRQASIRFLAQLSIVEHGS
jgi:hypothetical protein